MNVALPGGGTKLLDDGHEQRQGLVGLEALGRVYLAHFAHGVHVEQGLQALIERRDKVQTLVRLVDQHQVVFVRLVFFTVLADHYVQEHVDVLQYLPVRGHLLDGAQRRQYAHGHGLVDERRAAGRNLVAEQQALDELELDRVEQRQLGGGVALLRFDGLGDHEQRSELLRVRFGRLDDVHAFLHRVRDFVGHLVASAGKKGVRDGTKRNAKTPKNENPLDGRTARTGERGTAKRTGTETSAGLDFRTATATALRSTSIFSQVSLRVNNCARHAGRGNCAPGNGPDSEPRESRTD